ncbi:tyrosine-type recombinase/integrase [Methylobacterium sp. P31]
MGLSPMVLLRLKYVVSDIDRHGNVRHYFRRRPEPKVRLEGQPGSKAFMAAYQACLDGKRPPAPRKTRTADAGTFAALCNAYLTCGDFKGLDASTQAWQRRALLEICDAHGEKRVAMLHPRHVRKLRDAKRDTPAAANTMLKALKAMFAWAIENDEAERDPTYGVKRVRYVTKGHHSWTLAEVEAYEARHPIGTTARLALALLLYTAGRREDVVRLGPQHLRAGRLQYIQAKNEHRAPVEMDIPVHADLAEAIAAMPVAGQRSFLVTEYGQPFSSNGFGNRFKAWCEAAGLPHCSAHGCRKATAARLAERKATPHQIMAITGHKTLEEVGRYTRAAGRAEPRR